MYEKHHERLLSRRNFFRRLVNNFLIALSIIIFSLFIGMLGYRLFEAMSWVDAYVNASMILSGMGPLTTLHSSAGKIFAGTYALFSGIIFLIIIAVILAPIIHRFLHKFHMKEK